MSIVGDPRVDDSDELLHARKVQCGADERPREGRRPQSGGHRPPTGTDLAILGHPLDGGLALLRGKAESLEIEALPRCDASSWPDPPGDHSCGDGAKPAVSVEHENR